MLEKQQIIFEKTVIVGMISSSQNEEKLAEYLDELEFLTQTAGGEVAKRFFQKLDKPNPKTFLGTGKIDEIATFVKNFDVKTVIFDDELTPTQQKNLNKIFDAKVFSLIEHE